MIELKRIEELTSGKVNPTTEPEKMVINIFKSSNKKVNRFTFKLKDVGEHEIIFGTEAMVVVSLDDNLPMGLEDLSDHLYGLVEASINFSLSQWLNRSSHINFI